MSTAEVQRGDAGTLPDVAHVDLKLEAIVIPVSDVDRAKKFYGSLGWRAGRRLPVRQRLRVVQFTPPGSGCSVQSGSNITTATPGSAQGLYLIVSDIQTARGPGCEHQRGVPPRDAGRPVRARRSERSHRRSLARPLELRLVRHVHGSRRHTWLLQEITTRLAGRIDSAETTFSSIADLAGALRRASTAHGEHEKPTGAYDENWPDWYSAYMVAEQSGTELAT
jgi:hypothetical protein